MNFKKQYWIDFYLEILIFFFSSIIALAVMNLPKEIAITSPRKITPARNLIRRKNLLLPTKAEKEKKALKINYKNIWLKPKNVRRKVENENDDMNVCFKKRSVFYAKN